MAGLGRKVFTAGDVLTASNTQSYLMDQSVMNFATAAARSSAIPTPTEGMTSYNQTTDQLEAYNGTAWVGMSGLTLVANVTVSGSAGIQIDNCFFSEYDSYRIVISNLSCSVAGSGLDMRLGSNVNLANYSYVKNGLSTGNVANTSAGANVTSWGLNFMSSTVPAANFAGDIIDPFVSNYTHYNGIGYGGYTSAATWFGHMFAGHYNTTTSFTGCYIFPTVGTFSCNVIIYGYRKS